MRVLTLKVEPTRTPKAIFLSLRQKDELLSSRYTEKMQTLLFTFLFSKLFTFLFSKLFTFLFSMAGFSLSPSEIFHQPNFCAPV
jgi:hypothetical protein